MSQDGAQGQFEGRSVGGGRYQLRDLLGAGGMASVHLAYDSVLDREVAIKTLHTELGREQAFRERFRREAQSVAKLTHTNIVSVFDSGEDELDGGMVPYIIMEYVAGQPLRSDLDTDVAQHGAMPTEKALKITADVLAALEVSHEMGLVHRDIKPGNVMLNKRGVVKVMDFGIARAMQSGVTSMTQTGMVVGTPQYLSPEQALGRGVDARSDLYSVGIMLFELLTGQLPFDADSPLAIAYAHVQEEPPVPSSINSSLPPARGRAGGPCAEEEPQRTVPHRRVDAGRVSADRRVRAVRFDAADHQRGSAGPHQRCVGLLRGLPHRLRQPSHPGTAQRAAALPADAGGRLRSLDAPAPAAEQHLPDARARPHSGSGAVQYGWLPAPGLHPAPSDGLDAVDRPSRPAEEQHRGDRRLGDHRGRRGHRDRHRHRSERLLQRRQRRGPQPDVGVLRHRLAHRERPARGQDGDDPDVRLHQPDQELRRPAQDPRSFVPLQESGLGEEVHRGGGWTYKIVAHEDSAIWGKNTVTDQSPSSGWWYPSKNDAIELTVSTGRSG